VPSCAVSDLLAHFPAPAMALDDGGRVRFWNEACRATLGYSAEEVIDTPGALDRLVRDPAHRAALVAWWHSTSAEHRAHEAPMTDASGHARLVEWRRAPTARLAPSGGTLAIGHDLTDQRRTERDLRESRERLRTAFEDVPLDFWIMDADGRYAMVNPAAAARWGDSLGKTVDEATASPEIRERWRSVNARAFAGEVVRGEAEYQSGGKVRTYEYVVAPIRHADGKVSGILGVNIDITERRHAEHERERSEATRGAILDALPDLVFRMSADGRYLDYHAPPSASLIAPPDHFLGRSVTEVLQPDHASACLACIRRTLSLGSVQRYEYSSPVDSARHYEVRMTPCGSDEVVALVRDISELEHAEQSLRESESRYRAIFDTSPLGVLVLQDNKVAMINAAGLALLGAGDESMMVGQDAIQFVAPAHRADAAGCVATALRDGKSPPHVEDLQRLDGNLVTVEAAGARVELGGRPAVQVIVHDVTQRLRDQEALREADEQLRQSQKMEAVGQLAAGVAHDFNNLLTAIFGYVAIARSSLDPSNPAGTALDGVQAAAEQASGVIRSLLAVSRKAVAQFTALDLTRVAAEAIDLLRAGFPSSITVLLDTPAEPVPVRGDPTLLKQVVLNLAINARDAMPRGGTLRVIVRGPDSSGLASLRVEDTGEGILPEIQKRVFEPFFTTKSRESSSGLGLSIAEGIVRSHAGSIGVASTPGRGAAFTIRLPAGQSAPALPAPKPAVTEQTAQVLVADESRQVREVIGTALARAGYSVCLASGPDGASRLLARTERPIGVAIVNVDTEDGAECLRRVRAAPGTVGVIALTAAPEGRTIPGPRSYILRKPFQVTQIPELVRRVLDDRASALPPSQEASP